MYNNTYNPSLTEDPYYYPTAYSESHPQAEDSVEWVYSQELEPIIPYPDDVFDEVDDILEEAEDTILEDFDDTVFDDSEDTMEFTAQEGMGRPAPPFMPDRPGRPQPPRPQPPRPEPPRPQPPRPEPPRPQPPRPEPPRPQPPRPQPPRPQPPRPEPPRPQPPRPQPPRPQPPRPEPPRPQPPRPQPPRPQPPRPQPPRPQPPRPQPPRPQPPRPDWSWNWGVLLPGNVFPITTARVRFYNAAVREPVQIYVNDRLVVSNLDFLNFTRFYNVAPGRYRITVYRSSNLRTPLVDTWMNFLQNNSYTVTLAGSGSNFWLESMAF